MALLPVPAEPARYRRPAAERGIGVSFQTVSEWTTKFGLKFAHQLKRRSIGNFADKWHLDEIVVSIKGKKYWLWRAVDANGYVLDALLQSRRNKGAEPPRVCRRPFGLSYAAMAGASSMA